MHTRAGSATSSSNDIVDFPVSFCEWLKRRRKELDLTQAEVAERASCSVFALRKIEAGDRRPSKQLAELLAVALEIPPEYQKTFIRTARGELSIERMPSPARMSSIDSRPALRPSQLSGNLVVEVTSFIGRDPELAALNQLFCDPGCSLLTITGPGGIGKTRLAVEAAHHSEQLFPDGVWFVSLASLNSPIQIVPAIASALDFKFQEPTNPQAQLLRYLHPKKTLLVLDNVEHLLDGVEVFTDILRNCPHVKLLATSRERLNLLSEWVFEIQGLPMPPNEQVEQFEAYSSVALFLQSTRRVRTGFELQEAERHWVLKICQILEGMPLGIELAAAWAGLLSCEEIAKEIEHNLDFLTVSMRDLPQRHRSLRATLDHSWKLLNDEERLVLSRLSVFRGSFSREAVVEICGANLSILSSLKDKSILRRQEGGRYDLHDLVHQYAALQLAGDSSEEEKVKDLHAYYYARLLAQWEKMLKSSRQSEVMVGMAEEIDNLRLAWNRMVTCSDFDRHQNTLFNPNLLHKCLFSLSLFYELRNRNREAITLFSQSIECLKSNQDRYQSSGKNWPYETVLGHITAYLGLHHAYILQYQQAYELLGEALFLLERNQASSEKAQAQVILAWVYQQEMQIQESVVLLEDSLRILRANGDHWWQALALNLLAGSFITIGMNEASVPLYQEALRLTEPGDLRLQIPSLTGLGRVHLLLGNYPQAKELLQKGYDLSLVLGNKLQTSLSLLCLGQVYLQNAQIEQAEKHFRECVNLLEIYEDSPDLGVGLLYLGKSLAAAQKLDEARMMFKKVIQIGQQLNLSSMLRIGLLNLARLYLNEGKTETAIEIVLILQQYSFDVKTWQDDSTQLYEEIRNRIPTQQIEIAKEQASGYTLESLLASIG